MPTRKYRIVATAPRRTGLTSTFPISTARYMAVSFAGLLGSAGAAWRAPGAARGGSGGEPGAEEAVRAVVVSGAQRLHADAAGAVAVGADGHDVVVAQVLVVAVGGARIRVLIVDERVGHLGG